MKSVLKWVLYAIGAAVVAGVATYQTERLATARVPIISTPGDAVMNWLLTELGPEKFKLGYRIQVIFGVDFFLYFILILLLLALIRWRFRKTR